MARAWLALAWLGWAVTIVKEVKLKRGLLVSGSWNMGQKTKSGVYIPMIRREEVFGNMR